MQRRACLPLFLLILLQILLFISLFLSFAQASKLGRLVLYLAFFRRLHPAAQHFRHAPRLVDAAARREGGLGVEDFVDRADTGFIEMILKGCQSLARPFKILAMNPEPGVDEGSDQPG